MGLIISVIRRGHLEAEDNGDPLAAALRLRLSS